MGGMNISKLNLEFNNIYNEIKDEVLNFKFIANKIVMFYYYDNDYKTGSFITYKINEICKWKNIFIL